VGVLGVGTVLVRGEETPDLVVAGRQRLALPIRAFRNSGCRSRSPPEAGRRREDIGGGVLRRIHDVVLTGDLALRCGREPFLPATRARNGLAGSAVLQLPGFVRVLLSI
jgi:hypothetical protein